MLKKFWSEASSGIHYIEENYLNGGGNYLFGDEISMADLSLVNGINYIRLIGFDFSKLPVFSSWFNMVMSIPEIAQENAKLNGLIASAEKAREKQVS